MSKMALSASYCFTRLTKTPTSSATRFSPLLVRMQNAKSDLLVKCITINWSFPSETLIPETCNNECLRLLTMMKNFLITKEDSLKLSMENFLWSSSSLSLTDDFAKLEKPERN